MNPIPQRLPNEVVGTKMGRFTQELINAATQLRAGNSLVQIPKSSPLNEQFLDDLTKVLDQIKNSEPVNPLNYKIPFSGEMGAFYREFLDAIEQMR